MAVATRGKDASERKGEEIEIKDDNAEEGLDTPADPAGSVSSGPDPRISPDGEAILAQLAMLTKAMEGLEDRLNTRVDVTVDNLKQSLSKESFVDPQPEAGSKHPPDTQTKQQKRLAAAADKAQEESSFQTADLLKAYAQTVSALSGTRMGQLHAPAQAQLPQLPPTVNARSSLPFAFDRTALQDAVA